MFILILMLIRAVVHFCYTNILPVISCIAFSEIASALIPNFNLFLLIVLMCTLLIHREGYADICF